MPRWNNYTEMPISELQAASKAMVGKEYVCRVCASKPGEAHRLGYPCKPAQYVEVKGKP